MYTLQLNVSTVVGNEVTEAASMHRKKCWGQLTRKREHITPVLKELHWLPVKQRTDHKTMPLAYKCLRGYGAGILAGTHSPIRSWTTPSLIIATTPTDSKCCWKNTLKAVWFPSLFQLCFKALECSTTNSQGRKHLGGVSRTSENTCTVNDFAPCVFLLLVYDFLSTPPPPPPLPALIETSYKARHHQQQQQKATKQSIPLRQPRTTPCSHGSCNRLNWDGVCVWVCVWGRSTDSPSPRPTPPRDDGGKDYIPHHHQNQLSFQTGFNLGSSWTYVMFTIWPHFCAHGAFVVLWLSSAWFLLFLLGVNYYFYGDQAY